MRRTPFPFASRQGGSRTAGLARRQGGTLLRLAVLLAVVALLGPALLVGAQAEEGATFHGNVARTGAQRGPNPRGAGTLSWRFQTGGAVRSSPVLSGGLVYFGSNDGRLYAVDAANGEPRWSFTAGGAVRSTPAVADGLVVFGSDDGYVYCLTADTGELRWRFLIGRIEYTAGTTQATDLPRRTVTASPLVVEGIAYIGSNDFTLYALDLATGIERWHTTFRGPTVSSPSYKDGRLYVGTEDGVWAVDARTGHILWAAIWGLPKSEEEEEDDADDDGDGTVNEQDGDADGDGIPDAEDPDVTQTDDQGDGGTAGNQGEEDEDEDDGSLAADLKDGKLTVSELMETEAGKFTWNVVAAPVVVDNLIYAVGLEASEAKLPGTDVPALMIGTLLQLDINTGNVTGIWSFNALDDVLTTPAVVDSAIYLGSDHGLIYAVEAQIISQALIEQDADGDEPSEVSFAVNQERWGVQTEHYVGSSPAVVGEAVYAGNAAGLLYSLDTKTGRTRWMFETGGPIWSSPAVDGGTVYVGSDDGFLYAIGGSM